MRLSVFLPSLLCLIYGLCTFEIAAQCSCTNCPLTIGDLVTVTSTINISGATSPTLGVGGQGVCGVQMNFSHTAVTDLIVTLRAPNGSTVTLMNDNGGLRFTSGTIWNIGFNPCSAGASPDPGFTGVWNNNQIWGMNNNYNGIYLPTTGCLESLTGSVNGAWVLTVVDNIGADQGVLFGWQLIFCNNNGINCTTGSSCVANAGDLNQPDITACVGSASLNFSPTPTYSGSNVAPPAATYSYRYVVSNANTGVITSIGTSTNLTAQPPGVYQVCGFSYLTADQPLVPVPNGVLTLADLQGQASTAFCGDLTDNCIQVTISPAPVAPVISGPTTLCAGIPAVYTITNYDPSQTYTVSITSGGFSQLSIINNQIFITPIFGPINFCVRATTACGFLQTCRNAPVLPNIPIPAFIVGNASVCAGSTVAYSVPFFPGITYNWLVDAPASIVSGLGTNQIQVLFPSAATSNVCLSVITICTTAPVGCLSVTATPAVVAINGPAIFCGPTATLSANPATFNSYSWNTGSPASSIAISTGGTYSLTVTGTGGCTATASITIPTIPFIPPVIATTAATICPGANATLSVTNGPYTNYNWSNTGNSASTTVSSPGTYTVTVTNSDGCTGTKSITIAVAPAVVTSITGNLNICNGSFTTLTANGAFPSYSWSSGGNTATISTNVSGPFTVTVTNAQGCTGTASVTVNEVAPPSVSISGPTDVCIGSAITLTAQPASLTTFNWSSGPMTRTINVGSGGTYTVTASIGSGCTATASVVVNAAPPPVPVLIAPAQICSGQPATISVNNAYNTYNWSTGPTTPTINVNSGGTYTVTVRDAVNCSGTASISIVGQPSPTTNISQTASCSGTVTLNAGPGFATYDWSNGGGNAQTALVSASGPYTVTVTNAAGCTGTAAANVNIPPPPLVSIAGNLSFCVNTGTLLQASPGFSQYRWNTGAVSANLNVNNAGSYTVTATNSAGCTATETVTVFSNPSPVPLLNSPAAACAGQPLVIDIINGPYATYNWNNNLNTVSISVTISGTYTVTVTESTGCTGTANRSVTVFPALNAAIIQGPVLCTGQRTLTATAGFTNYAWSGGQTGNPISITATNTYQVTVTNAAGCTGIATINAIVPPPPDVNIDGPNQICAANPTLLTATPGFNRYRWSTGDITQFISINQSGTYFVTVTDNNNCTDVASISVTAVLNPLPDISGPTTICPGGTAVFSVATTFFAYEWSNGSTNTSISVGTPGTYQVTVRDISGCTGTDAVTLSISNTLSPNITIAPYQCNGQRILNAGNGFANYSWNNAATTQQITVNINGNYTVTVRDAGGCSGTGTIIANIPALPTVNIVAPAATCANTTINLSATPGFSQYAWSNGQLNANTTANPTTTATYTVTITDNNTCTATATALVAVNALPLATIAGSTVLCNGSSANLTAPSGLAGYVWSSGQTTAAITVNTAETYSLTVTNTGGCTGTATASIEVDKKCGKTAIFIPNIIAPESVNNGYFTFYGDFNLVKINILQIYDRWGNQMAAYRDLVPGQPGTGWDGRFNGSLVLPGVYVYWAKIELADGSIEILSGDVTVRR